MDNYVASHLIIHCEILTLFQFFSVDLETMQHCKGPFIASHILSSYSRRKETMTRGLDVSSIRHNGTDTDEKLEALLLTRVSFTTTKM